MFMPAPGGRDGLGPLSRRRYRPHGVGLCSRELLAVGGRHLPQHDAIHLGPGIRSRIEEMITALAHSGA